MLGFADISLLNSLNATSLPRRWGGGDGIALAAGLAPTDMLWPCASWPAPQGGDGVVSMSAELLGDQRRAKTQGCPARRPISLASAYLVRVAGTPVELRGVP